MMSTDALRKLAASCLMVEVPMIYEKMDTTLRVGLDWIECNNNLTVIMRTYESMITEHEAQIVQSAHRHRHENSVWRDG